MSNVKDFVIENGVLVKYTGKGGAVVIPEGITKIGEKAFQKKGKITSVVVPAGTEEIGEQAFAGCGGLEGLELPESIKVIGNSAFKDCPKLKSVTAPASVTVGSYVCENSRQMADADGFVIIGSTLCKYYGPGGAVVIPEGVTHISVSAFEHSLVTSVVIPKGVTEIVYHTFGGCRELTEVVLPEGLTKIGFSAFNNCEKLGSIVIPKSVVCIEGSAFAHCTGLKQVVLSEGIETIEQFAFLQCTGLTEITIPASTASIGQEAFVQCDNLKRITILSDHCKISPKILDSSYLLWYKFVPMWYRDISALSPGFRSNAAVAFAEDGADPADVRFEGHIKYIKSNAIKLLDRAMEYPPLLALMCREKLIAAKHVESFLDAAQQTGNLELVAMVLDYQANKLTGKQKEKAEQQKEKQENTVLDRAVARVNQVGIAGLNFVVTGDVYTFANRKELKAYIEQQGATLQSSMSARTDYLITNDPDAGTEKKRRAAELGIEILTEAQFNEKAGRQFEIDEKGTLTRYVGSGGDVTIPDGVRIIGPDVFRDCSKLISVTVSDSVVAIGEGAFSGCEELAAVTLGSSVTAIGDYAFSGCKRLSAMRIPDSVAAIGKGAFLYCRSLKDLVIPDSVEKIGGRAFQWCESLSDKQGFFVHRGILLSYSGTSGKVVIPEGVAGIGDEAFYSCSNLSSVRIGSDVSTIGNHAFENCSKLNHVSISAGVTTIGENAFAGCWELNNITIPDSVTTIGEGAFSGCWKLKDITIPDSVASLGNQAFFGCSDLAAVTIGHGVTVIGQGTFEDCNHLTSVTIPEGVTDIGTFAFASCYELASVTIPDSVTSIGDDAFELCDKLKIYGKAGSCAERYAAEYDIPFVTESQGERKVSKTNDFVVRYGLLEQYRGTEEDVVIPDGVTGISFDAFRGCETIVSVTFPDSVTRIPPEAFRGCQKLTSVRLGSGICDVQWAFNRCPSLTRITMPTCVGAVVSKSLVYSDSLRIDIPDLNVLSPAFRLCAVLCFAEDGGLAEDPRFESYSKYIQANSGKMVKTATENPALLALLCQQGWIKAKDMAAYLNAAQQAKNGQILAMVKDYLNNTLTDKDREKIKKQQALQEAASDRAAERKNREGIAGLSFVLSGDVYTFENRKALKAFIEQQGAKLQTSMSAKTDYLIMNQYKADPGKKQTAEELGIEIITEFQFNDKVHRQFAMDENGTLTRYRGAGGDVTIPQSVNAIGKEAFMHCHSLLSVAMGSSVTAIEPSAFHSCSNLTAATIGSSVTTIGKMAFFDCTSLNSVSIPDSVASIDDGAFLDCKSLTCITIPGSVATIGNSAFGRCAALSEVNLGSGVTTIGESVFLECKSLTCVTIPDSVAAIGDSAFGKCAALTKVTLGSGIATIGKSAFRECKVLSSVTIPDSVTTIGEMAFRSCDSLSEVHIGAGVTAISGAAFLDCKSLASVNIPGRVTTIGNSAFGRCEKLASVTIGSGTTTIEPSAFRACGNLAAVAIPATVTSIGEFAFRDCPNLTIYGKAGSYAETYAKENNIPFVAE